LIYATPGETDEDLSSSVRAVLDAGVDHLSAYSLIIEPGTRMAAQVKRGEITAPDDDVAAHRYEIVDSLARDYGLEWYEVSNWAKPGGECQHNLGYWRGGDWWAIGPGAHGYLGGDPGIRWWNIKHPQAYADAVNAGRAPVAGSELIDGPTRILESVMLGLRLREGIESTLLPTAADPVVQRYVSDGLLTVGEGRIRLTDAGRLLADACVRDLCGAMDGPLDPA
jgi:oxygen-independent coproporphyrinogen-3 oxidase